MLDRAEINAELLTELAKVLLCDVKAEDILSGKLSPGSQLTITTYCQILTTEILNVTIRSQTT